VHEKGDRGCDLAKGEKLLDTGDEEGDNEDVGDDEEVVVETDEDCSCR
jgi:hypothetical protein